MFVEDPLHTIDDVTLFAKLRSRVTVPLAAGEQFGGLRDGNLPLVEQGLIDFLRTSIPNCGGITSYRALAALCEAHSVSLHPSDRPGLGVVLDESRVNLVAELTGPRPAGLYQGGSIYRPDGSYLYL